MFVCSDFCCFFDFDFSSRRWGHQLFSCIDFQIIFVAASELLGSLYISHAFDVRVVVWLCCCPFFLCSAQCTHMFAVLVPAQFSCPHTTRSTSSATRSPKSSHWSSNGSSWTRWAGWSPSTPSRMWASCRSKSTRSASAECTSAEMMTKPSTTGLYSMNTCYFPRSTRISALGICHVATSKLNSSTTPTQLARHMWTCSKWVSKGSTRRTLTSSLGLSSGTMWSKILIKCCKIEMCLLF